MAEIHRCFSLLEKGGQGITACKLHSQGQGGETAGTRGMIQTHQVMYDAHPRTHLTALCPTSFEHKNRVSPDPPGCQLCPCSASCHCPEARERRPEPAWDGSSLPSPRPTHSVRALSRNWCFVCCPCRSWRRNTWPGMPWGFRLRSFTCSSAILAWTKTANLPSLRDQGRRGQPGPCPGSRAPPSGPAKF